MQGHSRRGEWQRAMLVAGAVVVLGLAVAGSLLTVGRLMPSRPVPATPSGQPVASATPTAAPVTSALSNLACTLAVAKPPPSTGGGFITFPGGSFQLDPATSALPPGLGISYLADRQRWVPVPDAWVTPDHTAYVTPQGSRTSGFSLLLVRLDGAVSTLPGPPGGSWQIISVGADGIYLSSGGAQGEGVGLYRVGYDGRLTRFDQAGGWTAVRSGYAFGHEVAGNWAASIVRLDLATGQRTPVFVEPGFISWVRGFDGEGTPVVTTRSNTKEELWLARLPSPQLLLSGASLPGQPAVPTPSDLLLVHSTLTDDHGLWIGTNRGVFLSTQAFGVERASDAAGEIASPCFG